MSGRFPYGVGWREVAPDEVLPAGAVPHTHFGKCYIHESNDQRPPKPNPPAAVDPRTIPALRFLTDPAHRRWVGWNYEWKPGTDAKEGKWTKPPSQRDGAYAKNNDPSTWSTCDEIWREVERGKFEGIGLMLDGLPGDQLAAIDLDDIRDRISERLIGWADAVVSTAHSYTEVTPSQVGVRILGTVQGIDTLHRRKPQHPGGAGGFELYVSAARYITISGHTIDGHATLADITGVVRELLALCDVQQQQSKPKANGIAVLDADERNAAPLDLEELPLVVVELITEGTLNGQKLKKRGPAFLRVVRALHKKGCTFASTLATLKAHPNGVQAKYGERISVELRRAWDKVDASTSGEAYATDGCNPPDLDEVAIQRLACMRLFDYERVRENEAKHFGVRVGFLDRLVKVVRGNEAVDTKSQGRPIEFPEPEPWPEPVDGAALLTDLASHFSRHLVLPPNAADAMALWVVHCHCFDAFTFTPRLQFKANDPGAGKSTAMELIKGIVPKPLETETATQASLFRVIEMVHPTVLLDEADTYLRDNEDMRGLVNAGVKPGGAALRCVGDNLEPRLFSCHAPIALAGLGSLPSTIEDRAIRVTMKRRLPSEKIEPIEDATHILATELHRKAVRWTADHSVELRAAKPDMEGLYNRAADRWRALYAIADLAGGDWPQKARDATAALTPAGDEAQSLGLQLLSDIRDVFQAWVYEEVAANKKAGQALDSKHELGSAALVDRLIALEGRPWAELGTPPKPLTQNRLARLLRPYNVKPGKIGPEDNRVNGYQLISFTDAFARNLPVPESAGAPTPKAASPNAEQIALERLDRAFKADAIQAPIGENQAERRVVREADWRNWFDLGMPGETQETKQNAFQRAKEGLIASGRVVCRDDYVWRSEMCPDKGRSGAAG